MKKRNKKAFTFIELLLAISIFSIIATSMYYTLNAGIKVWTTGDAIIRENQEIRIFFDRISEDLRNAVPFSEFQSRWTGDSISFFTIINVSSSEKTHRELVRKIYYFDDKKSELKTANVLQKEGFGEEYVDERVLLSGLEDVSFTYAYKSEDEYEWKEEWEFGEDEEVPIPRGIKIKLTVSSGDGIKETFEKIVFVPTGQLGKEE